MKQISRWGMAVAALAAAAVSGCGTQGAPQPPSLRLPGRVTDLTAVRAGSNVTLHWTMPRRDTDRVALKGSVTVSVCRRQPATQSCAEAGTLHLAPGTNGEFTDSLPADLTSGPARPLQYLVELKNQHNRSAGPSNAAEVVAGAAPAPVIGLAAALQTDGVKLTWSGSPSGESVRLYRKLLTAAPKPKESGLLAAPAEPTEQKLLVSADAGVALDAQVVYGSAYEYRAQRIVRVGSDGQTLELPGEISAPVHIAVEDIFPPGVPQDLAAVATALPGVPLAIDLSWTPRTDRNLAGYIVYRREGESDWRRISPDAPVVGPAFRDAHVEPGHTYRYAISAVSRTGHESAKSAPADESTPER